MRQSIRGYADGVIQEAPSSSSLAVTASELAAVRDLINGSDDLRRVLLDPGVARVSRRNVVGDLLAGRVSEATLRLLVFAVDADRPLDLPDTISWLVARIEGAADNLHPLSNVVLGRRAAEERLDGYASAVLEGLAGESEIGDVEDDLFRFRQIVAGSEELAAALGNPDLPRDVRRKLVVDLLADKATPAATELASYATQIGRPRDYQNLLAHLVDRVAAERNRRIAEVRSAVELDEAQRHQLASVLGRVVGREVDVRVTVDPDVLAGFIATVGDTVVDGSARHRLELLKERLVLPEVTPITGDPTDG